MLFSPQGTCSPSCGWQVKSYFKLFLPSVASPSPPGSPILKAFASLTCSVVSVRTGSGYHLVRHYKVCLQVVLVAFSILFFFFFSRYSCVYLKKIIAKKILAQPERGEKFEFKYPSLSCHIHLYHVNTRRSSLCNKATTKSSQEG